VRVKAWGVVNWRGMTTLFAKEVRRFLKVAVQTVATPVVTSLLYLLVFRQVLEEHVEVFPGVSYSAFLIPGLVVMAMLQNAFANSSSSLIQSKMNGNLVFVLLAPLSALEFFLAFVAAAVMRGAVVGVGVFLVASQMVPVPTEHPLVAMVFGLLASGVLGALGLIAGVWADGFDKLSAFTNFVILPLSFLSGVFYSIRDLPPFWQQVSHFNPFFYLIDGFRYGFLGVSDVPVAMSLAVGAGFFALVAAVGLAMLARGYKIRG
jgi:ABC-2 type transport system permease protein